jgi:hypothetical protein
VSSYWMTLRKGEDTVIERGSTRSHFVENSFWNRLWTCRKTDYVMMMNLSECRYLYLRAYMQASGPSCCTRETDVSENLRVSMEYTLRLIQYWHRAH